MGISSGVTAEHALPLHEHLVEAPVAESPQEVESSNALQVTQVPMHTAQLLVVQSAVVKQAWLHPTDHAFWGHRIKTKIEKRKNRIVECILLSG